MVRTWTLIGILVLLIAPAAHARDLFEGALNIRTAVYDELDQCGIQRVDAWDPALPKPQTPAHEALLTPGGFVLGYVYRASGFGGQSFTFKRTNGHTLGWIGVFGDSEVEVGLSWTGKVAQVSTYYTPAGEHFLHYCKSQQVGPAQFDACVQGLFIEPLADTLCSY
jgi:hypothetical protein